MLTTILSAIVALLPSLLKGVGVSDPIDNLVAASGTALAAIIAGIKSGNPVDAELTALEAAMAVLQANTSLDPVILDDVAEAMRVLQAAIAEYRYTLTVCDPSTLTPIPE